MKIFKTPFAATGDRIAIPVVEQPSGEVSQPTGWTPDYQLPNTDPNYKPVGRDEMNGVLFEITEALGQIQQFGFADWQSITGGWPLGANVRHDGGYWQSLANANTEEPGTGVLWKELLFDNLVPASETIQGLVRLATTAEAQALTDDVTALTPKKLADAFGGKGKVFAGNDYTILPNGLIRQWGKVSIETGGTHVVFPIAFPNRALNVVATHHLSPVGGTPEATIAVEIYPSDSTKFGASSSSAALTSIYWTALGY